MAKHMHTVGGPLWWGGLGSGPLAPPKSGAALGTIFARIFKEFTQIFRDFARFSQILPRFPCFFPDFHQTKTLGGAFAWASEGGAKRAFALPLGNWD